MTPSRETEDADYPYRTPSPPPSDPSEPRVPAKVRARMWFKQNADHPAIKVVTVVALLALFAVVGLSITAFDPVTSHGEPLKGIANVGISMLLGFVVCVMTAVVIGFCFVVSMILGDALKDLARRL